MAITGAHLGTGPAGMSVTFGTTAVMPAQVTKSTIMVTVPAHAAGAVDVTVTVNGQQALLANGDTYGTVQSLPVTRPSNNAAGTPSALPLPRP